MVKKNSESLRYSQVLEVHWDGDPNGSMTVKRMK